MDLFDHVRRQLVDKEQPLAARMRPRVLDEFVGQEHILAPGRLLRRAIQADQLSSLIFYGPPGTGKTTLATVIANTTESHFVVLNAVLSGVQDVRTVTRDAQARRGEFGKRTILFVDEVHRWNKAQQDALLPWVENGTVILLWATTENPFFTVNRALVSRSRVFQLKPLDQEALIEIARRTLAEPERGYGDRDVILDEDALAHLVNVANGDARALLNALELAAETTEPDADGRVRVDMVVAEESIQRRAVLYDKEGDYHFDTISAFIKSLRGSDADAAMYWLAKMVYAGEDPRFLFRRMLIFCGEDIGLADPNALVVTEAAAAAFDRVGMPEGRYHLGMSALYLATAPKSNSVFAFFDALATVEKEGDGEVPNHLRDASRDKEGFGHGVGYLYPHAYRDHWVTQQYLPDGLQGKVFYKPGRLGYEQNLGEHVQRRREAQLAAAADPDVIGAPPEILTFSRDDRVLEQWLARTLSGVGGRLSEIRDRMFAHLDCRRHDVILDPRADTGLLVWEAVRRTPEGGTYALVSDAEAATALQAQAAACPELRRPQIVSGTVAELPELLRRTEAPELRFDGIVGRNVLGRLADKRAALQAMATLLQDGGRLALAETVLAQTPRLYGFVKPGALPDDVEARLREAEESIYAAAADPLVNWGPDQLQDWAAAAGLQVIAVDVHEHSLQQRFSASQVEAWFAPGAAGARPSYADRLRTRLTAAEIEQVHELYLATFSDRSVPWGLRTALLRAQRADGSSGPELQLPAGPDAVG